MNKKTLYELGEEYYEQADILHSQITAVREKLKGMSPLCKEAYCLKSTLSTLSGRMRSIGWLSVTSKGAITKPLLPLSSVHDNSSSGSPSVC